MNDIELRKISLEMAIKTYEYSRGEKKLIEIAKEILEFLRKDS